MPTFSLQDLAKAASVSSRTVRYYIGQGLLPAPVGGGRGAHYGQAHLDRLRLIRRLQAEHLPLAEIRERLTPLSDEEIASLVDREPPAQRPTSALDYVRGLLAPPEPAGSAPAGSAPARRPGQLQLEIEPALLQSDITRAVHEAPARLEPSEPAPPPGLERSQWERISVSPNVEVHIRRPLGRHEQKQVERVVAFARQILRRGNE